MTSSALHKSRSAERALHLLDTVVTAGSISLGDAARVAGLPTSTALRHLRALEHDGYLDRDPHGAFSVGPTFLRLALTALREGPVAHLTKAAQPHLDRLAEVTGESAYLAVRERSRAVYIATAESTRAIRAVGTTLTGDGEATVHRNTGAVEPDVSAAVAPVLGADGTVVAAISVLGPASRLDHTSIDAVTDAVLAAAGALEGDLRGPAGQRGDRHDGGAP